VDANILVASFKSDLGKPAPNMIQEFRKILHFSRSFNDLVPQNDFFISRYPNTSHTVANWSSQCNVSGIQQ
jgi:hypothetical protein